MSRANVEVVRRIYKGGLIDGDPAPGDFVEAKVFQNSGGNLSVSQSPEESPELSMTWLAPGP